MLKYDGTKSAQLVKSHGINFKISIGTRNRVIISVFKDDSSFMFSSILQISTMN